MEEEPSDPHEQQLFVVYKSCLTEGQKELDIDGLLSLCNKLELEENHKDAIYQLLKIDRDVKSVSFCQFRDSFLALLGKFQESTANGSKKDINGELQNFCKSNSICTRHILQTKEREKVKTMDCQQIENDKMFDHHRLQETWSNQNSLSVEDVNGYCSRGSPLSKQMVEFIFEKLDLDCDGFINVNEFLHFFQSVNNKFLEQSSINWSMYLHRDHAKSDCCKDFIHHQTGHVSRSVIIEQWEVAGVSEANSLLLDLGFEGPTVNLIDLSNALSSELTLHRDTSHSGCGNEYVRLLKGALTLYQEEVRNLNSSMEHLCCERDKLRTDIGEANERANILAQEIDDHQVRMEKARQEQLRQLETKHAEALKELTNQLHVERDKSTSSVKSLEEHLKMSQQEEQRIRNELATVLQELKLLETENQNQSEEITKLQTCNNQLSQQVQELAAAQEQVESIETKENEQVSNLMSHIKRLQAEMKILRDHNDELTSELEMLKHRDNDIKSVVSSAENRSTISDENEALTSNPTTEVSDTEDEDKHQQNQSKYFDSKSNKIGNISRIKATIDDISHSTSINKLFDIIQDFRNFLTHAKFCAECIAIRNEVSSFISLLEWYQSSVPVIPTNSISNKRRKHFNNLANELEAERKDQRMTESCRDLFNNKNEAFKHYKRISSSDDTIHDIVDGNYDNSFDVKSYFKNKLSGIRDYPSHNSKENAKVGITNAFDTNKMIVELRVLLKQEESKHTAEKLKLMERCNELEKSLELLKTEYEQCEDYWAGKLEEERQIFEQEQKISDEKLSELLLKMAEYEEQFSSSDKHNDGRLSPIEEKVNLEQQYNDLEDEFERWRIEAQEEIIKKEKEIEELKAKLSNERQLSFTDISVQFPDEQMKIMYPTLYSALCSPSGSSENASVKVESAVCTDIKSNTVNQCHQCHKSTAQNKCDCGANIYQQHNHGEYKARKGDTKSKHYHHQRRMNVDYECSNLIKQREKLKQEIMKLQNLKTINSNNIYPLIGAEEQNVLSNLCTKLYAQEQKEKYLQIFYYTQQKDHERILQEMWKQHLIETADLRFVIKSTEEKLNQHIKINKEQTEKLTQADFLTKELYVENAQLSETIKRLEQHCQILTQNRIESSSA